MKSVPTFIGAILVIGLCYALFGPRAVPLAYVQAVPPAEVQTIQSSLRHAGAYDGPVNGEWRSDSASALQRFQATQHLPVTGELNPATAMALGIDPAALPEGRQAVPAPAHPPG